MPYVLIIMLWYGDAPAVDHIPAQTEKLCEAARVQVLESHDHATSPFNLKRVRVSALCVQVSE